MATRFSHILDALSKYQLLLVLVALAAGLTYPHAFLVLNPWNSLFLQIIMFATGLRLDYGEFLREAHDWRTLVLANAMKLAFLPLLVALPLAAFAPEWMLPFVLAATMPTGLTAPTVVGILGGRMPLAILISVTTSLLSPITVPLVLRIILRQTVQVNTLDMMLNIAIVVILPLALAALVQWKAGRTRILKQDDAIRLVNLIAFALVIASVAATTARPTEAGVPANGFAALGTEGMIVVALMTIFWLGIAWLTSALLAWRNGLDRMTVAFCLVYMNTTLAVWIADRFFRETGIAPKLVAIFLATTLVLPIFKFFVPHEKKKRFQEIYAVEQI